MTSNIQRKTLAIFALVSTLSLNACAGLFGMGGTSWKEEVLLHDGSKLIVERAVTRGGRHEIGQRPAYTEQSLNFTMPATGEYVVWADHFSEDIGNSSFLPMLVDIRQGIGYLVARPMGCLSYNKWGRPNPPYVIFKYQGKVWTRIPVSDLPAEISKPNIISSQPDTEVEGIGKRPVPAETIQEIISNYRQPEFRSILREQLAKDRIEQMCEERVLYKGLWILPNDPIARKFIDELKKKDSIPQNSGDR